MNTPSSNSASAEALAGPQARIPRVLWRWGGTFTGPRSHVARLDPAEGRHDGMLLGALFVAGVSVYPVAKAVAALLSTGSWLALASGVGRSLLAPVVVVVLTETLLGRDRAYRAGLCLLPLVVVGTAAHAAAQLGVALGGPVFWPEVAGGVLSGALAWWIRSSVPAEGSGASQAEGANTNDEASVTP